MSIEIEDVVIVYLHRNQQVQQHLKKTQFFKHIPT